MEEFRITAGTSYLISGILSTPAKLAKIANILDVPQKPGDLIDGNLYRPGTFGNGGYTPWNKYSTLKLGRPFEKERIVSQPPDFFL